MLSGIARKKGKKNRAFGRKTRNNRQSFIRYWTQRRNLRGLKKHIQTLRKTMGDKHSECRRAVTILERKLLLPVTVGKKVGGQLPAGSAPSHA